MPAARFIPLPDYRPPEPEELLVRARIFEETMRRRRTIRDFSDRAVSRDVIETCLRAAGSAPSGANLQPWHFVAVSEASLKKRIREGAEAEERAFYEERATPEWLQALAALGTDAEKPFLETAPWLIAVFVERYRQGPDGMKLKNYYPTESVGIAAGLLIAALHHAGLASLTHTPSPMKFLNEILERPASEAPFLLLVTGYPAEGAKVPDIHRKPLEAIATFRTGGEPR